MIDIQSRISPINGYKSIYMHPTRSLIDLILEYFCLLNAPVVWYSKRQNTVESSTFGSEFVALRVATELIQGLLEMNQTNLIPTIHRVE